MTRYLLYTSIVSSDFQCDLLISANLKNLGNTNFLILLSWKPSNDSKLSGSFKFLIKVWLNPPSLITDSGISNSLILVELNPDTSINLLGNLTEVIWSLKLKVLLPIISNDSGKTTSFISELLPEKPDKTFKWLGSLISFNLLLAKAPSLISKRVSGSVIASISTKFSKPANSIKPLLNLILFNFEFLNVSLRVVFSDLGVLNLVIGVLAKPPKTSNLLGSLISLILVSSKVF